MKTILLILTALIGMLGLAWAQQVLPPFKNGAMVCAFNTSPPVVVNSSFVYLQCDSQGRVQ